MWDRILDHMLRGFFRDGAIDITYPDGTTRRYGSAAEAAVSIRLHDPNLPRRLIFQPEMALGEAYMRGRLTIKQDDLDGFFTLLSRNASGNDVPWWRKLTARTRYIRRVIDQRNPMYRARQNVAHHYDLSSELYDLFLDEDRQYSCAYFKDPSMTLEAAQNAKKRHIAEKLLIEPGMEVFEIGCGWGGMALTLARDYGARVLGVTLSAEQHRIATERAAAAGLADRVKFELRDYRKIKGTFDRIVSIGMFEHVGAPHYAEYFGHVRDRLKSDGIALIHSIGRVGPPSATSPWITKYIFPGGYVPALSEMAAAVEKSGLYPTDVEIWRLHYAETLRHWHDRFMAQIDKATALYDDAFCRMWRFYLKSSEHAFRHSGQCVFQYQMTRHQNAVPLTRDYLYPAKARP